MANGKCRGCELLEREIRRLLSVNSTYKWLSIKFANDLDILEAQLASEKEKDTIARFEQYEAGNS